MTSEMTRAIMSRSKCPSTAVVALCAEIVNAPGDLGYDITARVGAAVAADEEHRGEHRLPSREEREVGTDGAHSVDHAHHECEVARRILDPDHAREFGQPPDCRDVDRAGEHGDVVQRDVD